MLGKCNLIKFIVDLKCWLKNLPAQIWNQALASEREELCGFCLKFFTTHFQDVALTPEFLLLQRELLLEALNSGEIDCSEDFILASVRSWVKYQVWKQHQENTQNNNNNGAHVPNFNVHILEADLKKMLLDFLPPKTVFSYRNKRMLMRSFWVPFVEFVIRW